MALKIIRAADPIHVDRVILTIYGPPGVGKTSLAFTAGSALLLDTDGGVHRARSRGDAVRVEQWDDISRMSAADVDGYDVVVVDTVGRLLDIAASDIMARDPKMGRGGSLSLQGYGVLKARFAGFLNLLRSFGRDVVLIAHADEKQQGDDMIERIEAVGSAKNEIYKVSDAMARLAFHPGGARALSFSPTDTRFGKDPADLGALQVSDDPHFLGGVINRIKERLNAVTAEQATAAAEAAERAEKWASALQDCIDPEHFTGMIEHARNADEKRSLLEAATAAGLRFDSTARAFTAVEEELDV